MVILIGATMHLNVCNVEKQPHKNQKNIHNITLKTII